MGRKSIFLVFLTSRMDVRCFSWNTVLVKCFATDILVAGPPGGGPGCKHALVDGEQGV